MQSQDPDKKLHGLLVVDKPAGWTSMDVVRRVRNAASKGRGKQKVGHAGTLDPLATGVLVLCFGRATRLVDRLMGQTKVYQTTIDLSAFTASDDAEMPREEVEVAVPPTVEEVDTALRAQTGLIEQVPPNFSAVHVGGRRAYQAARKGESVVLGAKQVRVDSIERLGYDWPSLELCITCGKGTYIRSIARDLGKLLGTGGHLTSLRRLSIGSYTLEQAVTPDDVMGGLDAADILPIPEQLGG